ncbi:MAG: HAD-IA family hydrolase [Lachnospiraceae bacterium]|nr:HAD-IA family hydrolase [Lachnospiraceae bacterium]
MKFDLLIFDFDGTLSDTQKTIVTAKREAATTLGIRMASDAEFISTIGLSAEDGFRKVYPEMTEEEVANGVKVYRQIFNRVKEEIPPTLFAGVKETLASLKEQGITLTIASSRNNPSLYLLLERLGIREYFSYIVGGDDIEHFKPHPEAVLKTLADLKIAPERALVVGDMPVDIGMGKGAGTYTCGVTFGNSCREDLLAAGADYVVDTFPEILNL